MAHYAIIDETNTVVQVITGRGEDDLADGVESWEDYYATMFPGMLVRRTSYNTMCNRYRLSNGEWTEQGDFRAFRFNYAGVGFTFDPSIGSDGAFIPPQPSPSWVLNEHCEWEAPIPYPTDGLVYSWDEETLSWVEVPGEAV